MGEIIFKLGISFLSVFVFTVVFYLLEKKTGFSKLPYAAKQIIIGIAFGLSASLATEFSVQIGGAGINIRDASPLAAGLIFGGPAGIISGIIGAVHRWIAVAWGAGEYTRLACSIACIIAGVTGAILRTKMFDNKKPTWFYGLFIGVTSEVFHLTMIFITHLDDTEKAFDFVKKCSIPMIAGTALTLTIVMITVSIIGREKINLSREKVKIAQTFQFWLLIVVLIAFFMTSMFVNVLQYRISRKNTENLLRINVEDISEDISYVSDNNLLSKTRKIVSYLKENYYFLDITPEELDYIAQFFDVNEIYIISPDSLVYNSNVTEFIGFDMTSDDQSNEFVELMKIRDYYVQDYRRMSADSSQYRKFAAVRLGDGYFLQAAYDSALFQQEISDTIKDSVTFRHIGKTGFISVVDSQGLIVSDSKGRAGEDIRQISNNELNTLPAELTLLRGTLYDEDSYYMIDYEEGYSIIGVLPVSEADFARDTAIILTLFMEVLLFAVLFFTVYFLIKKTVVDNINKINDSLGEITKGNLNVVVKVRTNKEFASLSDDINTTVDTMKNYIEEAANRINKELEFAKEIQHSAMPGIFPPFPEHREFDIFASMNTAKEVGGDFYDFYMPHSNRLIFLIADVSGKGIPAAMFMMTAKTLLKSVTETGTSLDDVFTKVNSKLCETNDAGMFVTVWMGELDLNTGRLVYVNAGHNPPLIKRYNGNFEYMKGKKNFVLAGMDDLKYQKSELMLEPGDKIYLYTDGVTEAERSDKELFGEERLLKVINDNKNSGPEKICEKVLKSVTDFTGEADQFDDITMLSVQLNYLIEKENTITLKADMASVPLVVDFIDKQMENYNIDFKSSNKIRIAVDEIYSNIVRYSGATEAEVLCEKERGVLRLSFTDNGIKYNPLEETKTPDVTASAEDREIGGLGVFIVRKIMDNVEYKYVEGKNIFIMEKNITEQDNA